MKKSLLKLSFFGLLLTQSCTLKKMPEENFQKFIKPVIIYSFQAGTGKSKEFLQPKFIGPSHPIFAGKYKFNDTINIDLNKRNNYLEKDLLVEYSINRIADSLDINGLDLVADHEKEIYFNESAEHINQPFEKIFAYYPVYLINSTNSNKLYFGKGNHGYGIQEAVDSTRHNWVPIECKLGDFCGNGDWGLIVRPNEFIVLLLKKYSGNIRTDMRVRIANGPTIYVSKPFRGYVNYSQFGLHPFMKKRFKGPEGMDPNNIFYGATLPKEWFLQ